MSEKDRAVVFVRGQLSPNHATGVSELYESGRKDVHALGESSIRRAVWRLVSRVEVAIDSEMKLRSKQPDGR